MLDATQRCTAHPEPTPKHRQLRHPNSHRRTTPPTHSFSVTRPAHGHCCWDALTTWTSPSTLPAPVQTSCPCPAPLAPLSLALHPLRCLAHYPLLTLGLQTGPARSLQLNAPSRPCAARTLVPLVPRGHPLLTLGLEHGVPPEVCGPTCRHNAPRRAPHEHHRLHVRACGPHKPQARTRFRSRNGSRGRSGSRRRSYIGNSTLIWQ